MEDNQDEPMANSHYEKVERSMSNLVSTSTKSSQKPSKKKGFFSRIVDKLWGRKDHVSDLTASNRTISQLSKESIISRKPSVASNNN